MEVVRLENVLLKVLGRSCFDRLLQHFCGRAALVGTSCSRVVYFKVTIKTMSNVDRSMPKQICSSASSSSFHHLFHPLAYCLIFRQCPKSWVEPQCHCCRKGWEGIRKTGPIFIAS